MYLRTLPTKLFFFLLLLLLFLFCFVLVLNEDNDDLYQVEIRYVTHGNVLHSTFTGKYSDNCLYSDL